MSTTTPTAGAEAELYVRDPRDLSPKTIDEGLPSEQLARLARSITERLLVDTVTPETDETGLAHVYSEKGKQYTVDVETGACTCPDHSRRRPEGDEGAGWRCKHGHRVEMELGVAERSLPSWAQLDAVDPLLLKRLGLDDTEADR